MQSKYYRLLEYVKDGGVNKLITTNITWNSFSCMNEANRLVYEWAAQSEFVKSGMDQ